ncbi:hypothetical protein [Vibrio salilacus]|uniref:hypothetical protein n=1 Tax=Vibrio salilacus TaxID=1323749 RepID=UPI0012FD6331|nr:hypothetical protein [Vibrio salilacus]
MKNKKDRAIVFAVSKNLTFSIACVLMDIKRLSPSLADEVVVLHDGICEKDKKLINTILPTRFIEYEMPFDDISFIPDSIINYFTKMVFAKFECLKLLNEYHSVMLSDYDIVIQKDISELFEYCDSGIKFMLSGNVRDQLHFAVDEYDMDADGICASIFVLQDHIGDYNSMYDFCYKNLKKYSNVIYLPEQSIFNFMIQEFNLNVTPLKIEEYSPHPTDTHLAPEAKIIHAYGQPKFWNGLVNERWNSNYECWLKLGGSRFRQANLLERIIKKLKKIGM